MKNIAQSLKVVFLAIILSFGISYVFAWASPTVAPTGGNDSMAPLNTSLLPQTKSGNLTLNALGITNTSAGALNVLGGGYFGGNVGIGTPMPGARLESKAPTTGSYNTAFRGTSNDGTKSIDFNIQNDGKANLGGNFINLGIGTDNPQVKLDVVGDANVSGTIRGATFGFGGMYSTDISGNCMTAVPPYGSWANPFTGNCSCPAGFTAHNFVNTFECYGAIHCKSWVCYK